MMVECHLLQNDLVPAKFNCVQLGPTGAISNHIKKTNVRLSSGVTRMQCKYLFILFSVLFFSEEGKLAAGVALTM